MTTELSQRPNSNSRSPYGERGLKYEDNPVCSRAVRSLSLRRAWIEISIDAIAAIGATRRSPYGERGLKSSL